MTLTQRSKNFSSVLPKGFMSRLTSQTSPTSGHRSPKMWATYFLESQMTQIETQQEYQEWQNNPKLQQEYQQWRLKDDLENLKQLDPNFQNQFNQIFGADK